MEKSKRLLAGDDDHGRRCLSQSGWHQCGCSAGQHRLQLCNLARSVTMGNRENLESNCENIIQIHTTKVANISWLYPNMSFDSTPHSSTHCQQCPGIVFPWDSRTIALHFEHVEGAKSPKWGANCWFVQCLGILKVVKDIHIFGSHEVWSCHDVSWCFFVVFLLFQLESTRFKRGMTVRILERWKRVHNALPKTIIYYRFLAWKKNTIFGIQFIWLLDLTIDRSFFILTNFLHHGHGCLIAFRCIFFPSTHKHSSANNLINVLFFLFWATNVSLRQILRAFCYVSKKPWYLQIIRVQFEQYNWPPVFGWSVLSAFPEARRFSWLFEHNSKNTKPSTEGWHSISFDHFCRSYQGDGVSDGQFVNVLTRELNLLEHGFKQMSATYNPQLVIIVGQYFGSFWPVLLLQTGVSRFLFRSTSLSERSYSLWCHFSAQGRGIRLVFGWSKVLKKVVAKSIPQIFRNKDGDFD